MVEAKTSPPLQRMLITIEYDGTGLVGWQRQDNGPSVQAYLEAAAKKLTNQPTPIQGSGRTDAGVHACAQAAHLDVPASLNSYAVVNGLHAWLETRHISVLPAQPAAAERRRRARRGVQQHEPQRALPGRDLVGLPPARRRGARDLVGREGARPGAAGGFIHRLGHLRRRSSLRNPSLR